MSEFNVYTALYSEWIGDEEDDYQGVVVAETKGAALGMMLEEYPKTKGKHWSIEKVDTSKRNIEWIDGNI